MWPDKRADRRSSSRRLGNYPSFAAIGLVNYLLSLTNVFAVV